uniref:Ankyrin repeat and protein kinase domain-containing protein 1 n=1 Tax=Magallana gigas TaxID=29159 RepID=K1Q9H1_MAGGI
MGNSKSSKSTRYYDDDIPTLKSLEMPQKERDLHLAVMANDREGVKLFISHGADINYPWSNPLIPSVKDSTTPLLAAILIKAGADINLTDRNSCSPLYKAAFHGRPVLIEMLLKAGADINQADKEGQTPLYICVQNAFVHSSYAAVECLLSAGASINSDVNKLDNHGRTPLYVCVSSLSTGLYKEDLKYQVPCIKVLYAAGCDMLNLVDWLKWKGPGIPLELMRDDPNFLTWYKKNMNSPHSLMNLCRKVIQQRLSRKKKLFEQTHRLPVPPKMKIYLSRIMFYLPAYDPESDPESLD